MVFDFFVFGVGEDNPYYTFVVGVHIDDSVPDRTGVIRDDLSGDNCVDVGTGR
jgi:hypothetical protein